jgi:dsDNA-specific endonuclease/ATPase MutS2
MKLVAWLKSIAGRKSVQRSTELADLDDDNEIDPYNPFPEPVTLEITDVIDLHTIHPKDVKRVVEEYLEQVHQAGFDSVRIIHGKGIGVQREIVRTVLARTSFVESWTDAPPDAGGLGATIVRLV